MFYGNGPYDATILMFVCMVLPNVRPIFSLFLVLIPPFIRYVLSSRQAARDRKPILRQPQQLPIIIRRHTQTNTMLSSKERRKIVTLSNCMFSYSVLRIFLYSRHNAHTIRYSISHTQSHAILARKTFRCVFKPHISLFSPRIQHVLFFLVFL